MFCICYQVKSWTEGLSAGTPGEHAAQINGSTSGSLQSTHKYSWGPVFQLLSTTGRSKHLKDTLCLILDIWKYLCQGEMNCASQRNLFFPYLDTPYISTLHNRYKTLSKRSCKESLDKSLVWQIFSVERWALPSCCRRDFLASAFAVHGMNFYCKDLKKSPASSFYEEITIF